MKRDIYFSIYSLFFSFHISFHILYLSQGPANAAQDPNCVLPASETQQDDSLLVGFFFCSTQLFVHSPP